jgi:hypothetical protein
MAVSSAGSFAALCAEALGGRSFPELADECWEKAREIWGEEAPPVDPRRLNHLCRHSGARPHYWEAVVLAAVLGLEWRAVVGVLGEVGFGWVEPHL